MAARKTTAPPTAALKSAKCQPCSGTGEITETVRVGARKKRDTGDKQTAVCLDCLGTGTAPTD
ncbi:hypothetical protein ACFYVL_35630 [Streptomyces sp. NPDC004111]|uniref:hypothetical protein n=1 Tax=Streptomyces sp. NPDC004111 TaxID=3364690 RepID=UPI00367943CA